ncbi:hypothetical protein PAMP_015664 [Pampus punctatissimus]
MLKLLLPKGYHNLLSMHNDNRSNISSTQQNKHAVSAKRGVNEGTHGRQKARGASVEKKEGAKQMKDEETERVKYERSDEMMKPSMKQEDAARKGGKRKHIKANVGELDKEKARGRERKRRVAPSAFGALRKLYATIFCPFFQSALEKMIALIVFLKDRFSCHRIASHH